MAELDSIKFEFTTKDKKIYAMKFCMDTITHRAYFVIGIYKILCSLGRSIRKYTDTPLFIDLKQDVDGSIQGCKIKIDKERFDLQKEFLNGRL